MKRLTRSISTSARICALAFVECYHHASSCMIIAAPDTKSVVYMRVPGIARPSWQRVSFEACKRQDPEFRVPGQGLHDDLMKPCPAQPQLLMMDCAGITSVLVRKPVVASLHVPAPNPAPKIWRDILRLSAAGVKLSAAGQSQLILYVAVFPSMIALRSTIFSWTPEQK